MPPASIEARGIFRCVHRAVPSAGGRRRTLRPRDRSEAHNRASGLPRPFVHRGRGFGSVPCGRKWRSDAGPKQAGTARRHSSALRLRLRLPGSLEHLQLLTQRFEFMLKLVKSRPGWIDVLAARRSIWNESGAVVNGVDRHGPRRDADDGRSRGDILGHNRVGADFRAFTHFDRPKHLRARADHHAIAQRRVALAADTGARVGASKSHVLVDGDIVTDLRALADNAEAMVEEEALADLRPRMDVDRGQEPREMI